VSGSGFRAVVVPYVAVAFAACAWGTWSLLLRRAEAIGSMTPAMESTIVMAVITGVTGATSLRDRIAKPATFRARGWIACLGVADAFNVLLFFAAYKITIGVSVLAHYTTPVLVAIAAPLVLKEKMTRRTAAALAVSLSGLAVILVPTRGAPTASAAWASAALGVGSAVFYASGIIMNKFVVGSFSTSETMFWHGVVATPLLAAFVPKDEWTAVDARAVAVLALVSLVPGAMAGMAFVWGLRRMPATHASMLTLLEPLIAVFIGSSLYGESMGPRAFAGGGLIVAGAGLVMTQAGGD
jgi:drug/metabolite transporter (DMT)-like permease